MKFKDLSIKDARVVEFAPFADNRGSFTRIYCDDTLRENTVMPGPLKHINHSVTARAGTIRGLRCQLAPAGEAKLVRCMRGRVLDVFVDLRAGSETFLKVQATELSGAAPRAVFVPPGCAHGFQALEDDTEIMYMTSTPYSRECEFSVRYSDPLLDVEWPLRVTDISDHDASIPFLPRGFRGVRA